MDELLTWDALYVPQTFEGFSSFFGVSVFSFGATIIILEIQARSIRPNTQLNQASLFIHILESMVKTEEFVDSLKTSLWIIWASYSVLGGAALLIYQQEGPVSDNIMEEMPKDSLAEEPVLLFITIATLFTYPLAMQPVASIIEQALLRAGYGQSSAAVGGGFYGSVAAAEDGSHSSYPTPQDLDGTESGQNERGELPPWLRYGLRVALVLFTGVCATSVPNFGVVVSLLGSFSVTLGSFVLPPLFHFVVLGDRLSANVKAFDIALFVFGVVTCVFTTTTTALSVLSK
ncbi:unnamed protein product [Laminaria digitata]